VFKALGVCKGQFFCGPDDANNPCVAKSKICDGNNDCSNGMDEINCGKSKIFDGNNDCSNRIDVRKSVKYKFVGYTENHWLDHITAVCC